MTIGAHVSAAGGLWKAIGRAVDIGAEAIQIFVTSPRAWAFREVPEQDVNAFRKAVIDAGLGPTVIHGSYLTALGSPIDDVLTKSVQSLTEHLRIANRIGALGVIFHPGSHRGRGFNATLGQFVDSVNQVLDAAPGEALLMLETSAGSGDHIGSTFGELGRIIRAVDNPRVAVCVDTQHIWAAGYHITSPEGLDDTVGQFEQEIGLDLLRAVHANDSKRPIGSKVDRHENIGEGLIGLDGFYNIMCHQAFRSVPFYLEVPGFDKKGPDRQNVELLKKIRASAAAK